MRLGHWCVCVCVYNTSVIVYNTNAIGDSASGIPLGDSQGDRLFSW